MGGWMGGWVGGWVGGWMDGWMDDTRYSFGLSIQMFKCCPGPSTPQHESLLRLHRAFTVTTSDIRLTACSVSTDTCSALCYIPLILCPFIQFQTIKSAVKLTERRCFSCCVLAQSDVLQSNCNWPTASYVFLHIVWYSLWKHYC